MSLPSDWPFVTLTGTYKNLDDTPVIGRVTFTAPQIVIVDGVTVLPSKFTAILDTNGSFTIDLPATSAPYLSANNWTYLVQEYMDNGRRYYIPLPHDVSPVDISTIAPVADPVTGQQYTPGPIGPTGASGTTLTTANYVQPTVGSQVTVSIASASEFKAGDVLYIVDAGYYDLISVSGNTFVLSNKNVSTNVSVGTTIDSGSFVSPYVMASAISEVGMTNDYNDLTNKPTIPAAQVNSDWNASSGVAEILNKPAIPTTLPPSGAAGGDLSGTYPNPTVAKINGSAPAAVATSGSYTDLSNKPTIPAAQVNSDWNASSGVAEILNKPTIPAAQVNSDWNASSGVAEILNKPTIPTIPASLPPDGAAGGDLSGTYPNPTVAKINGSAPAAVATSGSYTDLTNKPTIPQGTVESVNAKTPDANGAVTLVASDVGAVPTSRTVAGHPLTSDVTVSAADVGAEPAITAGTTSQYLRGDKTWQELAAAVLATALTGFSTSDTDPVVAADEIIAALGKLQAQVYGKFDKTGGTITGTTSIIPSAGQTKTLELTVPDTGIVVSRLLNRDTTEISRVESNGTTTDLYHNDGLRVWLNNSSGILFTGNGSSRAVSVASGAYFRASPPSDGNIPALNAYGTYATSAVPLTKCRTNQASVWAWNGTNGYSITSTYFTRLEQRSAVGDDAVLRWYRNSDGAVLASLDIKTGELKCSILSSSGPTKFGEYTLATTPSAATYSGYYITVTDATGGAKLCRSDGTNWNLVNTTTPVS